MPPTLPTAADVSRVREVSLAGVADLDFWTARLADEALAPKPVGGRAHVQIIAAELTFWGVTFREISFSVAVGGEGLPDDASFCIEAYNTNRLFAFFERFWFSTPYDHGAVAVALQPPSLTLRVAGDTGFHARMAERAPSLDAAARWEGPVLLPSRGKVRGNLFLAAIEGRTRTVPYDATRDTLELAPRTPILRDLLASHFVPTRWEIRPDARHWKSVTARRSDVYPAGDAR